MRLKGEFMARPPSPKEIDAAMYLDEQGEDSRSPGGIPGDDPLAEEAALEEFNLADAADAARTESDSEERIKTIFESELFGQEFRLREEQARARYRRTPFIEGVLRVGLHAKAFEASRSKTLSELYPIDEMSGLRWLEVKLDQDLPRIGMENAEKILLHVKD